MKKYLFMLLAIVVLLCVGCGSSSSEKTEKGNPYEKYKTLPINASGRIFYEAYDKMPKTNLFIKERQALLKALSGFGEKDIIRVNKKGGGLFSTAYLTQTDAELEFYGYYMGETKNGKPHGIGTVYSGLLDDQYSGYFEDGIPKGYGIIFDPPLMKKHNIVKYLLSTDYYNSSIKYEGYIEDWLPEGEGVVFTCFHYDSSSVGDKLFNGIIYAYAGKWDEAEPKGKVDVYASIHGTTRAPIYLLNRADSDYYDKREHVKYPNGITYLCYTGEVNEYLYFDGAGVTYYPNGNIHYKGDFKRSRATGKGVLYSEDGRKLVDNT